MKTLKIYGPIFAGFGECEGCCFAGDFANEIAATSDDIAICINSPGGEIEGMVQIANALKIWAEGGHSLTVTVEGLAASAAAYLLLNLPENAKVKAYNNSAIMYHGASLFVAGGEGAMQDAATYLKSQNEAFREALSRTEIPAEMIEDCLKDGRSLWLNGKQAFEYGIVDEILGGAAPEIVETEKPKYKAVALFYPNRNHEEQTMKKTKAKAEETEVKEVTEEIKEEVKEEVKENAVENPATEEVVEEVAETVEEKGPAVADLEKTIEELTKRVEVLEQKLLESQAETEEEKAKVTALSGGLKATAKVAETKEFNTFSAAYADYRKNHPEMSAGEAFVACAKANPDLHRACIYEKKAF